jgi:hypothetical protein
MGRRSGKEGRKEGRCWGLAAAVCTAAPELKIIKIN